MPEESSICPDNSIGNVISRPKIADILKARNILIVLGKIADHV